MNNKEPTTLIYSSLAQATYKRIIKSKPHLNLNLVFLSLLKWLPICFASIWYNDQKTPNYQGLIMALFWYSFSNQFIRYRKINHQISLTEQYYELGLARFISETLEISYFRESIIIILAALIVELFQFFIKHEFNTKNTLVKSIECQWVLLMQIFLFFHYFCVQTGISFPFTAPVMQLFLLIHFIWLIHLAYQFLSQTRLRWHLKQRRKQSIKAIILVVCLLYIPISIYILKTHFYSGVGDRLYIQAISALIVAGYLSKKCIQKRRGSIRLKSIKFNVVAYIISIVVFGIYYIYYKKLDCEWQNNYIFNVLTLLFIITIVSEFKQLYTTTKMLAKCETNSQN